MKKTLIVLAGLIAVAIFFCRHFRAEPSAQLESAVAQSADVEPAPGGGPALPRQPARALPAAEISPVDNDVLRRIAVGDTNVFKLSAEQIRVFLARNRQNADSLLAAFNVTADPEFLRRLLTVN